MEDLHIDTVARRLSVYGRADDPAPEATLWAGSGGGWRAAAGRAADGAGSARQPAGQSFQVTATSDAGPPPGPVAPFRVTELTGELDPAHETGEGTSRETSSDFGTPVSATPLAADAVNAGAS